MTARGTAMSREKLIRELVDIVHHLGRFRSQLSDLDQRDLVHDVDKAMRAVHARAIALQITVDK